MAEHAADVVVALKEAKGLVARGWVQGHGAVDGFGRVCDSLDPGAMKFCILGACYRATPASVGYDAVVASVSALVPFGRVASYNDAPDRTQSEVLELFDKAIASLETSGASRSPVENPQQ